MKPSIASRVAVITGAARGIGAAVAKRLATDNMECVLLDLTNDGVARVSDEIRAQGGRALSFACDVSDAAQVEHVFETVQAQLGRVDILINNAGITRDNLLFKMTESDWDDVMQVHLKGTFLCTRAAQRLMVEQRYGKIVNVSSVSALGNRGQANYSAAKAGLQGFTKTVAIELGPYGINVNAVAPGFIDTEMTKDTARRMGISEAEFRDHIAKEVPLRRIGQPEDIANVIRFLVSDDASYVSGQIIYVDGGRP